MTSMLYIECMEQTARPIARYSATYFNPGSYAKKYTMPSNDLREVTATAQALAAQGKRVFIHDAELNTVTEVK